MYTILAVHDSYQQTGDLAALERGYDSLVDKLPTQWLEEETGLVRKQTRSNGCNSTTDCDIVDWPASERDGYVFDQYNTVINAISYRSFADMATIATAVGEDEDARRFTAVAERLREAMNARMFDEEKGAYRDGLRPDGSPIDHFAVQASVFATAFGVPTPELASRAADYLGQRGMQCSVYCAAFFIESLYNGDRGDVALDLLTDDGLRSWMNMIRNGAGATAEAWDVSLKPNMTWSHPWAASPAYHVPQGLFGIRPLEPGYGRFTVRPQGASLDWAHVTLPTLKGRIGAAFERVGERTDVGVAVPGNTQASVYVPARAGSGDTVHLDGKPVPSVREGDYLRVDGVGVGCHVLSTLRGGRPLGNQRLREVCDRP